MDHDGDVDTAPKPIKEECNDQSTNDSGEHSDSLEGYRYVSGSGKDDMYSAEEPADFDDDSEGCEQMYIDGLDENVKTGFREMKIWSQPSILREFIALYKSEPCLWRIKSEEYTNKVLKEEAYNKLLSFCKSKDPSTDIEFVKSKINSIRTSYRKELTKIIKSKRTEADTGLHVPKLWYFDLLDFLRDYVNPRPVRPIIREYGHRPSEVDMAFPMDSSLGEGVGKRSHENADDGNDIKKQAFLYNKTHSQALIDIKKCISYRTEILSGMERSDQTNTNRFDAVGRSVANVLRKMDRTQQLFTENIINKALFLGLLGRLNSSSDIQTSNIYDLYESPDHVSPAPSVLSPDVSVLP